MQWICVVPYIDSFQDLFNFRVVSRTFCNSVHPFIEPVFRDKHLVLQLLILIHAKESHRAQNENRLPVFQFNKQILQLPANCTTTSARLRALTKNVIRWLHPVQLLRRLDLYNETYERVKPMIIQLSECPSGWLDSYLPTQNNGNYRPCKVEKVLQILGDWESLESLLSGLAKENGNGILARSSRATRKFLCAAEQQTFCDLPNPAEALQLVDPNSENPLPVVVQSIRKKGDGLMLTVASTIEASISEIGVFNYRNRWLTERTVGSGADRYGFSAMLRVR